MQVLKKEAVQFIKGSKHVFDKLYKIREFNGDASYYIYNGNLLKTGCFNIQWSLIYAKVSISVLKKDEVYVISEMDNKKNVFNLFYCGN